MPQNNKLSDCSLNLISSAQALIINLCVPHIFSYQIQNHAPLPIFLNHKPVHSVNKKVFFVVLVHKVNSYKQPFALDCVEILLNNAIDFFETAEEKTSEGKFTVAVVNCFKALISLVDYGLFLKKGIFPRNHEERFRILQYVFPDLLGIVRDSYGSYRRAYSERLDKEDADFLKEEVLKVAKEIGVLEKFSK